MDLDLRKMNMNKKPMEHTVDEAAEPSNLFSNFLELVKNLGTSARKIIYERVLLSKFLAQGIKR